MKSTLFFPADAHEGPVWVSAQQRLYYATKTHLDGRRRVDIEYLDFSPYLQGGKMLADLPDNVEQLITPQTFVTDANMANGMRMANDETHLLVAEQGDLENEAAIAVYHLQSGQRARVIDESADGKPFNSPNKVIESEGGHLIFSDPDYGFRQHFRPPPELEPNLYLLAVDAEEPVCFRCGLEMPHGLALSPDETTLFVSDTSNEGAHREGVALRRRRSVWRYKFDPLTPEIIGPGICCFQVDEGAPDGMAVTQGRLLVGGGDGVYVANLEGQLLGKIPTPEAAVNVELAEGDRHLFVTIDTGVLLIRDWRGEVD